MLITVVCVFVIGVLIGYILKSMIRTDKGPSSRSVQEITYSNDYKFIPVIHVCSPSVNPDDYEHSSD